METWKLITYQIYTFLHVCIVCQKEASQNIFDTKVWVLHLLNILNVWCLMTLPTAMTLNIFIFWCENEHSITPIIWASC